MGRIGFKAAPAPAPATGQMLFGVTAHPMKAAAQQAATAIESAFYAGDQARVDRYIDALLPFKQETVESWAAHTLNDCRAETLKAAELSRRFAELQGATTLDAALESLAPSKGVFDQVRKRFLMSAQQREAAVRHLRGELEPLLGEVRKVKPNAEAEGKRLAALLLSLRAVAQASGTPPTTSFELALDQRLGTLRAALTQANMVPEQLRAIESSASLQMAQCDRLLNVAFTASKLAGSGAR